MNVGKALVDHARAIGHTGIAVVGTGKNVGKTVTTVAVYEALRREGIGAGITSVGRDGEEIDALDARPKPRFFLWPGTFIATATGALPAYPALEIMQCTKERSALGPIVIARVHVAGWYEIVGPPSADALRRVVRTLRACGAAFTLIDGSLDRIAALREGEEAIILAAGAESGATPERVVTEVRALARKLSIPVAIAQRPVLHIPGALHAGDAATLAQAGERRQVLVRDATRITFGGNLFLSLAEQLDFRCEHVLHPVAATVASVAAKRFFEPSSFLREVAQATALPTYDVYAQVAA